MAVSNLDDYLKQYGTHLAQRCRERLKPLHDPTEEPHKRLAELTRKPFVAQAHVITACAKLLERSNTAFIVAECGSGKTFLGMGAAHLHAAGKPYRGIVFCPGQLLLKWQREILETIPGVTATVLRKWHDAVNVLGPLKGKPPAHGEWYIIARDTAKLGAKWRPAVTKAKRRVKQADGLRVIREVNCCPGCGAAVTDADGMLLQLEVLERKPTYCGCGSPLWTYTSQLRKWAPATYIHKKLKGVFDYLVVDEVHQAKSGEAAQAQAVGSLSAACKRTIALTGTLMGGYAEDLRPLLFRLCPTGIVKEGFGWSDSMKFAEKYGRIKTTVRDKEGGGTRNKMSRGSTTKTKKVDPGILPGLFGNHLLDKAIFLALDQIAEGLPEMKEQLIACEMEPAQEQAYKDLESDMMSAVKQLVRTGNRQLLGTMVNSLLYYEDTCYATWDPLGYYEGKRQGEGAFLTVHIPSKLSSDVIYPKEQALLDFVMEEKKLGRQCWVYVQLTEKHGLLERLRAMFDKAGLKVGVLKANVELSKREEWIAKNGKGMDVVISHPKLVETGLDLFDKGGSHNFCTLIFYQTGYNLFTLRQASRRSWRIGQQKECKVVYLYYQGTMQERAMTLMGRKLAAAEAIDGKFSTEGLAAAAEDEGSLAMMLAKNLVDKLDEDPALAWAKTGAVQIKEEPMRKLPRNLREGRAKGLVHKDPLPKDEREGILVFSKPNVLADMEARRVMLKKALELARKRCAEAAIK